MKFTKKITIFGFILIIGLINFACASDTTTETGGLPQAYKSFYEAVKSKNSEEIKKRLSKGTLELAEFAAMQQKKTVEKVIENGFTATTMSDTLPKMRDERVNENFGSLEVFNQRDNRWEDVPFIKEDGKWKIAMGELFSGTFKSPGKSQAALEQENSNSAGNNLVPLNGNISTNSENPAVGNSNVNVVVIDTNSDTNSKVTPKDKMPIEKPSENKP